MLCQLYPSLLVLRCGRSVVPPFGLHGFDRGITVLPDSTEGLNLLRRSAAQGLHGRHPSSLPGRVRLRLDRSLGNSLGGGLGHRGDFRWTVILERAEPLLDGAKDTRNGGLVGEAPNGCESTRLDLELGFRGEALLGGRI